MDGEIIEGVASVDEERNYWWRALQSYVKPVEIAALLLAVHGYFQIGS